MSARDLADRTICSVKTCGMPNIIWQSWRETYRCGWCRKDYTPKQAQRLSKLSETAYRELMHRRESIVGASSPGRRTKKGTGNVQYSKIWLWNMGVI